MRRLPILIHMMPNTISSSSIPGGSTPKFARMRTSQRVIIGMHKFKYCLSEIYNVFKTYISFWLMEVLSLRRIRAFAAFQLHQIETWAILMRIQLFVLFHIFGFAFFGLPRSWKEWDFIVISIGGINKNASLLSFGWTYNILNLY